MILQNNVLVQIPLGTPLPLWPVSLNMPFLNSIDVNFHSAKHNSRTSLYCIGYLIHLFIFNLLLFLFCIFFSSIENTTICIVSFNNEGKIKIETSTTYRLDELRNSNRYDSVICLIFVQFAVSNFKLYSFYFEATEN